MKVFISWSGKRSKALAFAVKEWLPLILQYAKPWVSDKDISAGDRWAQAIAGELENSNFGILCITPENINSQWILFEAGALSKSMLDSKVIPLLFDLELSDLSGPLSQFQASKVDEQGMLEVARAINSCSENKALDTAIEALVPALWPRLEDELNNIPEKQVSEKHMRPQTEILEDLVSQVRGLGARMRDADAETVEREIRSSGRRFEGLDSRLIEEVMHAANMSSEDGVSLLVIAGFVRERIPWLAEIMVETHRELKVASPPKACEIMRDLINFFDSHIHSPIGDRIFGRTKEGRVFMMQISRYLEMAYSVKAEAYSKYIAD